MMSFKKTPKINLGSPGARFWRPRGSILEGSGTNFQNFRTLGLSKMVFCDMRSNPPSNLTSFEHTPSSDPSNADRAHALKKSRICRERAETRHACLASLSFHTLAAWSRGRQQWGAAVSPNGVFDNTKNLGTFQKTFKR